MTQEQILQGNKLIAVFMGGFYERKKAHFDDRILEYYYFMGGQGNWRMDKKAKYQYAPEMLCYHVDWDWLMPVVEKMSDITNQADKEFSELLNESELEILTTSIFCPIKIVFERVIAFITWHNSLPTAQETKQ